MPARKIKSTPSTPAQKQAPVHVEPTPAEEVITTPPTTKGKKAVATAPAHKGTTLPVAPTPAEDATKGKKAAAPAKKVVQKTSAPVVDAEDDDTPIVDAEDETPAPVATTSAQKNHRKRKHESDDKTEDVKRAKIDLRFEEESFSDTPATQKQFELFWGHRTRPTVDEVKALLPSFISALVAQVTDCKDESRTTLTFKSKENADFAFFYLKERAIKFKYIESIPIPAPLQGLKSSVFIPTNGKYLNINEVLDAFESQFGMVFRAGFKDHSVIIRFLRSSSAEAAVQKGTITFKGQAHAISAGVPKKD